jgi:hypothetical protein
VSRTRTLISRLGRVLFLGVASLTLSEQTLRAQLLDEYKVKAAFLYNFTKFVEWPQQAFRSPGDPLTICILGENPFGSALTEMANASTLNGRRVGERDQKHPGSKWLPDSVYQLVRTLPGPSDHEGTAGGQHSDRWRRAGFCSAGYDCRFHTAGQ